MKFYASHKSDHWATPRYLYNIFVNKLGCIDPIPLYSEIDLDVIPIYDKNLYLNIPFSKKKEFLIWINNVMFHNRDINIILLLPNTIYGTSYWKDFANSFCGTILFLNKRLKYNDSNSATFYSSIFITNFHCKLNSFYTIDQEEVEVYLIKYLLKNLDKS